MGVYSKGQLLFNKSELHEYLPRLQSQALQEVEALSNDDILNCNVDELSEQIVTKHKIELPVLHLDKIHINNPEEVQFDVSKEPGRYISNRSRPFYVNGLRVSFSVPYTGNKDIFFCRPLTYDQFTPPKADVSDNELRFIYEDPDSNLDEVKRRFESEKNNVNLHLGYASQEINEYNSRLKQNIVNYINQRVELLKKRKNKIAELGYPVKSQEEDSKTYSVPITKKEIKISIPTKTSSPSKPEPILRMEDYEAILETLDYMNTVFEQDPKAFISSNEETIRSHFLVQLNGTYKGQATAETFNCEGKTDILLKYQGKNVFISECKFWGGEKILLETIDQILGYTSWRDTKTSILIFNRNKNLSRVLAQISEIVKSHPNFLKVVEEYQHETKFRYLFRHKNDNDRSLILTICVYDVPK